MKTRILLLFPDVHSDRIMQTYTGNMARNIYLELLKRDDVEIILDTSICWDMIAGKNVTERILQYKNMDAIIFAGLKVLSRKTSNISFISRLRLNNPKAKICQLSDQSIDDNSNVDITFCTKKLSSNHTKSVYVGWIANPNSFVSEKPNDDVLRILVDHPCYTENFYTKDISARLLKSIASIKPETYGYKSIETYRLGSGRIIYGLDEPPIRYDRNGIPFSDYANLIKKSDIFVVTHPESVGLSALEAAMGGCLVLSPKNYIPTELLTTIEYKWIDVNNLNWDDIIPCIDHKKQKNRAVKHDFSSMIKIMMQNLTSQH